MIVMAVVARMEGSGKTRPKKQPRLKQPALTTHDASRQAPERGSDEESAQKRPRAHPRKAESRGSTHDDSG